METDVITMPRVNLERTGENIERIRNARSLTVRELQDFFGFATPQAIYKWQHGTALPTVDNLVALAVIFRVSVEEILVLEY